MIDGEHYASVVRDALVELPHEIVACVFVGGAEKLRGGEDYGVPLAGSLEEAIAEYAPDVVLDLSDEPVLGPPARFRLAARALALGVPYEGADFRLEPPRFETIRTPSVAVIGTGKRVGKTAVTVTSPACWRGSGASSWSRWGVGGRPSPRSSRSGRRSPTCSRFRAPDVTPLPTTSRRRRSPACRPSAAGAAAAGSPARSASRTSLAVRGSPRSSAPT